MQTHTYNCLRFTWFTPQKLALIWRHVTIKWNYSERYTKTVVKEIYSYPREKERLISFLIWCYEAKIEESEKTGSHRESNPGHFCHLATTAGQPPAPTILYMYCISGTECLSLTPAVVFKWQSTGGSSQRCPGFDSWQLPALSLFLSLSFVFAS